MPSTKTQPAVVGENEGLETGVMGGIGCGYGVAAGAETAMMETYLPNKYLISM